MMQRQQRSSGRATQTIASFLLKTYQILQHPQNKKIICWDKDDIGFVVIDVINFTRQILPKYFRHSNFSSFVRQVRENKKYFQLNMYDFHKVKQQNDMLVFKNPMFCRGEQQKLRFIKRKASKKIGGCHRRFYQNERNNSQKEKNQSALKWLKRSMQTEITQSCIFFQKSLDILKENNQLNKNKDSMLTQILSYSPSECLDLLFEFRQKCSQQLLKSQKWSDEYHDILKRKMKGINAYNSQINLLKKQSNGDEENLTMIKNKIQNGPLTAEVKIL